MRGIRGATTVEKNNREEIAKAVRDLLIEIIDANNLVPEKIGAAIFSMTKDLDCIFPAFAARSIDGFEMVPLFDAQQLDVENSIEKCIRVLLLTDLDVAQNEIKHIYHNRAISLRPDLLK